MIRPTLKYLLVGAILAGTSAMNASRADAHLLWWRHWGVASWWCDPCYGVSYSPYVVHRPWRPVQRVLYGLWWCPRCCVWCESSPCDACGCDGSVVTTLKATPQQAEPHRAPPKTQATPSETKSGTVDPGTMPGPGKTDDPGKSAFPDPGKTGREAGLDRGLLTIRVPQGAKVFVNGYETRSQGTRRQFVSSGLVQGKVYPYAVTVMVPRGAQGTVQTSDSSQWEARVETIYLKAGQTASLDFDQTTGSALVAQGQ